MPPLIWTSKLKCRRKTHNIYTLDRMVVDGESYLRIIYSHLLIAFIVHIIRQAGKSIDFQWCDGFGQLKDPFSFIHLTEQSNATVTNVCINVIDMTVVKIRLHCIAFFFSVISDHPQIWCYKTVVALFAMQSKYLWIKCIASNHSQQSTLIPPESKSRKAYGGYL